MKKKLLALFAIVAFVVAPTFASTISDVKTDASIKVSETNERIFNNTTHPTWTAGVALGWNTGLAATYRIDPEMTVEAVLGIDLGFIFVSTASFELEVYGMYKISEFEVEDETFDVKVGPGAMLGWNGELQLAALAAGEVSYSFDDELPIDLAFRLALGIQVIPELGFAHEVAIIGTYRFI